MTSVREDFAGISEIMKSVRGDLAGAGPAARWLAVGRMADRPEARDFQ